MTGYSVYRTPVAEIVETVVGEHRFGGGGSISIPAQALAEDPEPMPYSAFDHPFAGWLTLSDMVADSNPELGDAMRATALVVRAAIEQSVAGSFPQILAILAGAGIPPGPIADAEHAVLSGQLPLSVGDLAEQAVEAYAELMETGTVQGTEPVSDGFLASVVHYGGHAILGSDDDPGVPPLLPVVRAEDVSDAFRNCFLPATPFRVTASLDLPAVASGQGFSIWCREPLRRRRGDNLVATEHTYVYEEVEGLANPRFQGIFEAVRSRYRGDIEDWTPPYFTESIDLARPLDNFYYVYELEEPKRSRAARKLRKTLDYDAVVQVLTAAVTTGVTVGTAAAGPAGPLLAPVVALARPAAQMVADQLVDKLKDALKDTTMTPWSITHTTLFHPKYPVGPLSMFVLISPAAPRAWLHRVIRDPHDPSKSTMDRNYGEKGRDSRRSRGMMGVTASPVPTCPSDLWGQVAWANAPAAWTQPDKDAGGFRVLVPHAAPGKGASYVSALRADVTVASAPQQ